jgi:hypothetical protein
VIVHLGNVLQLQKVHRLVLAELARRAPLLPGADVLAFVDIDSQEKRVYGVSQTGRCLRPYQDPGQEPAGARSERAGRHGMHAAGRPVIAATRLRGGNAASACGAASMITEGVTTARTAGCTGTIVVRIDSAFYGASACRAAGRAGTRFSVTVRMDPKVRTAIAAIAEDTRTPIRCPRAIWDDQLRRWVSDAQVAEGGIHRVHLAQGPGDHRPADRPPGQGPQPPGGARPG